jgi:hypothetical protein
MLLNYERLLSESVFSIPMLAYCLSVYISILYISLNLMKLKQYVLNLHVFKLVRRTRNNKSVNWQPALQYVYSAIYRPIHSTVGTDELHFESSQNS